MNIKNILTTNYLYLIIISGFALFCNACSKEDVNSDASIKYGNASLNFQVNAIIDGASETLEKVSSLPESGAAPIGDGMLIEYSIAKDGSSQKSSTTMGAGKAYRIALYTAGGSYVKQALFTVGGNQSMICDENTTYQVVCLSYNTTSDPGKIDSAKTYIDNIAPSSDLLYYKGSITTSKGDNSLSINFSHLFSRVSVKASSYYNQWKLSNVTAKLTPSRTGKLALLSGTMSQGSNSYNQNFTLSAVSDTIQQSDTVLVFTNSSAADTLTFTAFTLDGSSYTNKSIIFQKSFAAGYTYTLKANIKVPIFAYSNIYCEASGSVDRLIFDTNPTQNTPNVLDTRFHEGVFFKWGSLIGLQPCANSTSPYTSWNAKSYIFVPTYNASSPTNSTWTKTATGTGTDPYAKYATWANIPYVSTTATGNRNGNYLYDYSSASTYTSYTGDICRYLSEIGAVTGKWRLPNSVEFGTLSGTWGTNTSWNKTGTWNTTSNAYSSYSTDNRLGKYNVTNDSTETGSPIGATFSISTKQSTVSAFFPASGYRARYTSGGVTNLRNVLNYWSGSIASGSDSCYYLHGETTKIDPTNKWLRTDAFPVRCIFIR